MDLYEDLMQEEWLLGTPIAPAFYEPDITSDTGLLKSCLQDSSEDVTDLLPSTDENDGLGIDFDLDWLDSRIDFSLLENLHTNPKDEEVPPIRVKEEQSPQLSEFQSAAIDLLETLMMENNADYTAVDQNIIPSVQPESCGSSSDGISLTVDSNNVSISSSLSPSVSDTSQEDLVISPQWEGSCVMTLEEVESSLSSPPHSPEESLCSSDSEWLPAELIPKKSKTKPYSRPSEEDSAQVNPKVKGLDTRNKKERKKVQNKNAATRYRQKKKCEANSVAAEMEMLTSRNVELKCKVEELEHEIKYMKSILTDISKVKGLIT